MVNRIVLLCKKSSATPLNSLHDSLKSLYFWFMTGKFSWVHSRTQGSTPMWFCRWSNVLWLLHPLLVPSDGRWLDQGRWSLYLLFCFCGNDRTMALYRLSMCVLFSNYEASATWELGFNNFKNSYVFYECSELDVIMDGDCWAYYDLGCMYKLWFEILRDFMDDGDYMGLSSMVRLCKRSLLSLISYNLGGSVTASIGARFSELLFISTF